MKARFPGVLSATWLALCLALTAVTLPGTAGAETHDPVREVLHGTLVHGGAAEDFDPSAVTVSLNVFEGMTDVEQHSTTPDETGYFEFPITAVPGRLYFISVEYQGARYSASRQAADLEAPVTVEVFEATHDSDVLTFETYTIIVTGAATREGFVEVLERAHVRNESRTTLVPDRDASGTAMPGFLRFGLPAGYYNLDVASSIIGGTILKVDRGFALDMPVPPTGAEPHEFEFVYRMPYEGPDIDLSRVMRFGAETLRIVVPSDVGMPASATAEDLGVAEAGGRFLRLLEGQGIEREATLELAISGLPMPSLWDRIAHEAGEWYLHVIVPSLVALTALATFAIALRHRPAAVRLPAGVGLEQQRQVLVRRFSDLEERRRSGSVSARRYEAERAQLKQTLVDLDVRLRLHLD